ncbi:MAG: EAL domain-containing protein, partial [Sphingomonas sp.]
HWRSIGLDLTAAVNISAKLVTATRFNADVRTLLARDHVPIDRLIFEVTESATLADPQAAVAALVALRDLGIGISMDDYGTGQSTLTYLRTLPLSELKIDRSFVQHAHVNHKDGVMVRSTIDLAHDLGLKVVAEGIEDADCLAFLRAAGCDMAQGYHISRPIPAAALVELLGRDRALAA